MKLLIYTRRGNSQWWRFVVSQMQSVRCFETVSELRGEGGESLASRFYETLKNKNAKLFADKYFTALEINDIIARCRLLRSLDRTLAVEMIGAMTASIDELISKVQPTAFLSTRVDSYVLDLFHRLLKTRDIPYIGLWRAALFSNMCFFTTRGESNPIREVSRQEVEEGLLSVSADDFAATSIRNRNRENAISFFRKRAYYAVRDRFLDVQRYIFRDPLGYRYLTSGLHVPEYRVSFADWRAIKFSYFDWKSHVANFPFEKRVFVALQVNPESTIDYYVKNSELLNCERVLIKMFKALSESGYGVVVKDHPNMYAMRPAKFFDSLKGCGNIYFAPYDTSSNELIDYCGITFTWTGTVGIQSVLKGRKTVVTNPTYFDHRAHIKIESINDLDSIVQKIETFDMNLDRHSISYEMVERVLKGCFTGSIDWNGFNNNSAEAKESARQLAHSLDKYIPKLLKL